MSRPDAATTLTAVIGHPVSHSLSPAIHNAALASDGRNAAYLAFDVAPDDLRDAVAGLRAIGAVGANVTVPHKTAALAIADEASEAAKRVGAANTLLLGRDAVRADTTDPIGVLGALADLGFDPSGSRVLVLGAGGAGRAAAWAVADAGATWVAVANRTGVRADALAERLLASGRPAGTVAWSAIGGAAAEADLVVHATSVGLGGGAGPLAEADLRGASDAGCRALLDLVYAPGETALVTAARAAGLTAADGLGMLVHQAAAAYERFWGAPAPLTVMRDAAARAAGRTG